MRYAPLLQGWSNTTQTREYLTQASDQCRPGIEPGRQACNGR